jgi:hypothetical protein
MGWKKREVVGCIDAVEMLAVHGNHRDCGTDRVG